MKWSDDQSAVALCDGDLHRGSGTEVEPLGFDQSLKLGSGHRLITEGQRFRSCPRKDRKSTRLNSSHQIISYAVFCLKKKKKKKPQHSIYKENSDSRYLREEVLVCRGVC